MVANILQRVIGSRNERLLRRYRRTVVAVNELESGLRGLDDAALAGITETLRGRRAAGEPVDGLIPEAFAVVREAGRRALEMRHFDVQLIGGLVLHEGRIAEMRTGEGKTLVATLAAYLNALGDDGVHIVTVNDYLARRDADWMGQIYHRLGMTVAAGFRDSIDAECEQHVAWRVPTNRRVAGVHEEHPIDNRGTWAIETTTPCRNLVHRGVFAGRVVLPDDATVVGRVGAHDAVQGAGEHGTRDDTHRRGLSWGTRTVLGAGRPRAPALFAGREPHGRQAPGIPAGKRIRRRKIRRVVVCCRSKLHTPLRAALADAQLPEDTALPVGIKSPRDARFLSNGQDVAPVSQCAQNRIAPKIIVGAEVFRAVLRVGGTGRVTAPNNPDVAFKQLRCPRPEAGVEVERDHGIAVPLRRPAVGIPGRDVQHMAFYVDRRRRPDSRTRGPVQLRPY